jgi:glycosyltransferase involved in cell wall biosynthesis
MNILLISYLFPPVNNPQGVLSSRLAKYLRKAGHTPVVLAGTQEGSFNSDHGVDEALLQDLQGIEICYIQDRKLQGPFIRFKEKAIYHEHYRFWVNRLLREALPLCRRNSIEIIYSLSAPLISNVAGRQLKRKTGIPWVAHFSDPINLALHKRFKSPLRTYLTYAYEKTLLDQADGITFVNEETLLRCTNFHPVFREKSRVVPHFYDPEYFPVNVAPRPESSTLRLSYVGSLYARRNPFDVVRAIEIAAVRTGVKGKKIELHLYGAIDPAIRKALDCEQTPRVRVHGSVEYRGSIQAMHDSDFLLLIDMPDQDNLYTPSKLIDYLASYRPIIGVTALTSSSARILCELGYPVFAPGDIEGLSQYFCELSNGTPPEITGQHCQKVADFRADFVVDKLVKFFGDQLTSQSKG